MFAERSAAAAGLSHVTLPAPALYQGRQSLPLRVLSHQLPHVPPTAPCATANQFFLQVILMRLLSESKRMNRMKVYVPEVDLGDKEGSNGCLRQR